MDRIDHNEAGKIVMFTVRVNNKTYRCPVAQEAICVLGNSDATVRDQIDSYLMLKAKIHKAVEQLLSDGATELPPVLRPEHFNN